jgi:UDP-N-acetylmuramyl pentapeptide synthase
MVGIILAIGIGIFIYVGVKNDIKETKTEVVNTVKTVAGFNEDSAAKAVAQTIHKFSTFGSKIKTRLHQLDSTNVDIKKSDTTMYIP